MSKEIEEKVVEVLTKNFIDIKLTWGGEAKLDTWNCDRWFVVLSAPNKKRMEDTFHTGLGLRKKSKNTWGGRPMLRQGCNHPGIPQTPSAASFLYSIFRDAEAIDMSFNDWCSDLGMNPDSIKDLHTYQECCKIGEKVRSIFGHDLRKQLNELLQDY